MKDHDENLILRLATEARHSQPERALEMLKDFIRGRPLSMRPKLLLASIFADEYGEDVPGAERVYREILASSPENVPALCGLAFLHGRSGSAVSAEESIRLLSTAADISGDLEILSNLAYKLWDLGRLSEAHLSFEKLLAAGRLKGKSSAVRKAEDALGAIRRGERPKFVHYWYPEVDYVAQG